MVGWEYEEREYHQSLFGYQLGAGAMSGLMPGRVRVSGEVRVRARVRTML